MTASHTRRPWISPKYFQELEKLKPQNYFRSQKQFLANFDRRDSMLQPEEFNRMEDLLVKFHTIFARHTHDWTSV